MNRVIGTQQQRIYLEANYYYTKACGIILIASNAKQGRPAASLLLNCNLIIRPSHYLRRGVLCYVPTSRLRAASHTLHKAHTSRLRVINHPCSDVC